MWQQYMLPCISARYANLFPSKRVESVLRVASKFGLLLLEIPMADGGDQIFSCKICFLELFQNSTESREIMCMPWQGEWRS